ncbi:MAG: hypothetical protein ACREDE_10455, partial [Thermoplasmata archaeon]
SMLPDYATLANGSAVGEARIPTASLGVETVQVTVTNASVGNFAVMYVRITETVPSTVLEGQILQLQYDLLENASRVYSLLSLQQNVENWTIFAIGVSLGAFAIETFLVIVTRTAAQEKRLSRRIRKVGEDFATRKPSTDSTGGAEIPTVVLYGDARAVFVAVPPECDVCSLPQTREHLADHLATHHIPSADIPRRIKPSVEGERHATESVAGAEYRVDPATVRAGDASRIDLTSVLGKKG